jgi:hypothetical protein
VTRCLLRDALSVRCAPDARGYGRRVLCAGGSREGRSGEGSRTAVAVTLGSLSFVALSLSVYSVYFAFTGESYGTPATVSAPS